MPQLYDAVTLAQVKTWLKASGTDSDTFLDNLCSVVTKIIETYIDKFLITREFTEYYDGQGKNFLLVRNYPIYSISEINEDITRTFGSTDEISSSDYLLADKNIGKIRLWNNESIFSTGKENVKIVYKAGYSRFKVVSGANNYIDFKEDGGSELNAVISAGEYDAVDFVSAVKSALDAVGAKTYTVIYNFLTKKIKITAPSGTITLLWSTGTNAYRSAGSLMGFNVSADDTAAASHEADYARTGLPENLEYCASAIAEKLYEESKHGAGALLMASEQMEQGGTRTWVKDLPKPVQTILNSYRREFL